MTSAATDAATRAYFAREDYFGLRADQCFFFAQGALPAFDAAGKVLLETPSRVCVAPDGNGGVYGALAASGALADMRKRGVAYVSQYCVDNALVKVGDPEFVGFAAAERADVACKVVRRVDAGEKVGVVALRGGRPGVVEYSELDAADAARVDGRVDSNHWFGGSPPNFRTLYLDQIEVDSANFWTNRLLSSSPRSTAKESDPNRSITRTLKSG
jgi:UDP-N-acetylglucosamine/UDP-N-acetylgalactosamine diphosphorylase